MSVQVQTIARLARETLSFGIVGMNFRNRHLVDLLNARPEMAVARDKIATKARLGKFGIATPETITTIRRGADIAPALQRLISRGGGFVVKPARSARGRGILLCRSIDPGGVSKLGGDRLSREEFVFHLHQILHGEFSFGRPDDTILVEQLIEPDRDWILPGLPGPPDLRIILCDGRIVMAMARLPTKRSDGRANLHCGAVGVGIDLDTGRTLGGVLHDRPADRHPDLLLHLEGHVVADFDACVTLAVRCREAFRLGYMGIDIMRDVQSGPHVLEVNARPGLGLQIANRRGIFRLPAT